MNVGAKVTLRGERMEEFLTSWSPSPSTRAGLRGVSAKAFDGRGNYALGVREQADLPRNQLRQGGADPRHGDDFRDHRHTDEEAKELLGLLGMPFAQ